jgi:hypothetical protein
MVTYYKSYRIIDEKPTWVISDENNNIIKDPTIEMKKMAVYDSTRKKVYSDFGIKERECCKCHNNISKGTELRYYDEKDEWDGESYLCTKCYKTIYFRPTFDRIKKSKKEEIKKRKCCICGGNETYVDNSGVYIWNKHKDENGNWDGVSYTCKKCRRKEIFELEKIPDSHYNYLKSNAKYRTKGFDLEDSRDKFIIGEVVVCKALKIENINIITDNFNSSIDTNHEYYKKIDVKIESPTEDEKWKFHTRRKWDCDHYFCLGVDENWKNIEATLIIPNDGWVTDISSINISRYPKNSSKYDQFRVDTRIYNDTYQDLMEFLKDKRLFTIEDIKKWLKVGK